MPTPAETIREKIANADDETLAVLASTSDVRFREAARDKLAAQVDTYLEDFSVEELVETQTSDISYKALAQAEIKKRADASSETPGQPT